MKHKIKIFSLTVLIIFPLLVGFLSLVFGRYPISITDAYKVLLGITVSDIQAKTVILNIRLPRVLLAYVVGAGLSVAGISFQSLFSNPLATPDTLGVASGASFGAILGIVFGFSLLGIQMTALIFGIFAVSLTFLLGKSKGHIDKTSIILSGIIIGALFNAFISLIKYTADAETELPAISYWLMGSLSNANYRTLSYGVPPIIIGLIFLFIIRWRMNILSLSFDEACSTGTEINKLRTLIIFFSTLITASSVSMCGQVGWIGLLIPHICRMIWGSDTTNLVPASISIGATFMIIIDTLARSVTASEIPISVLTAIIGAPFFILLLKNSRRCIV